MLSLIGSNKQGYVHSKETLTSSKANNLKKAIFFTELFKVKQ